MINDFISQANAYIQSGQVQKADELINSHPNLVQTFWKELAEAKSSKMPPRTYVRRCTDIGSNDEIGEAIREFKGDARTS